MRAAGILEQVRAGGVGDAEVGREPERRAVHDRHALGLEQVRGEVGVGLERPPLGVRLADQRRRSDG